MSQVNITVNYEEVVALFSKDKNDAFAYLMEKILNAFLLAESEEQIGAAKGAERDEWKKIEQESDEIGYCLTRQAGKWTLARINSEEKLTGQKEQSSNNGYVKFDDGVLSPEEINAIFNTLPVDITFVDRDGAVKYFSQGKERIFAWPKTIVGRKVQNCHPPASVHIVEKVIEDLRSGKKDHEDFWIRMGDSYVYIRYFAVRNEKGEFLGTLEVTQNIKPIQEIT